MAAPFTSSSFAYHNNAAQKIDASRFYDEYHGHPVQDLELLLPSLREHSHSMVWTAGLFLTILAFFISNPHHLS